MTTDLTGRLQEIHKGIIGKARQSVHRQFVIYPTYTETFDEFSEAMCKTDFLKEEEKFIIRKLLKQWRMNKNVIR